jgi:hypothetical protein
MERSMLMLDVRWLNGEYRRYACVGGKDRGQKAKRGQKGEKRHSRVIIGNIQDKDRIVSTERKGHTAYTIALSTG